MLGRSSWDINEKIYLISAGTAVGKVEGSGPLEVDFDIINESSLLGQKTFEEAEEHLLEQAISVTLAKANLEPKDINLMFSGDLMNQIISSNFAARNFAIPYIGLFGACSTSMLSLALAGLSVAYMGVDNALCATVSHNNTCEKQFRYPNEYGAQKHATCQFTATAAGAGIVSINKTKNAPRVRRVSFGKVIDKGVDDPFNMGAAMAPAACDLIVNHFRDFNLPFDYYDVVATGDLGAVGHNILVELLHEEGVNIPSDKLIDCGMVLYGKDPAKLSGASGCGCSACVAFGHIYRRLANRQLKRVLIVATGALMSPLSCQQNNTIPAIAHGVALEVED